MTETVTQAEAKPWVGRAQRWLQAVADRAFAAWLATPAGGRWKARRLRPGTRAKGGLDAASPYAWGFALPDEHAAVMAALKAGDEVQCKALMLVYPD